LRNFFLSFYYEEEAAPQLLFFETLVAQHMLLGLNCSLFISSYKQIKE
jgi:hypothetical protein